MPTSFLHIKVKVTFILLVDQSSVKCLESVCRRSVTSDVHIVLWQIMVADFFLPTAEPVKKKPNMHSNKGNWAVKRCINMIVIHKIISGSGLFVWRSHKLISNRKKILMFEGNKSQFRPWTCMESIKKICHSLQMEKIKEEVVILPSAVIYHRHLRTFLEESRKTECIFTNQKRWDAV